MREIERMETDGSINNYVKQEQSAIRREHARLFKYLDGLRSMDQLPDALFVVDLKREHNAVAGNVALGHQGGGPRRYQLRSQSGGLPGGGQR